MAVCEVLSAKWVRQGVGPFSYIILVSLYVLYTHLHTRVYMYPVICVCVYQHISFLKKKSQMKPKPLSPPALMPSHSFPLWNYYRDIGISNIYHTFQEMCPYIESRTAACFSICIHVLTQYLTFRDVSPVLPMPRGGARGPQTAHHPVPHPTGTLS